MFTRITESELVNIRITELEAKVERLTEKMEMTNNKGEKEEFYMKAFELSMELDRLQGWASDFEPPQY